ncbi:T9SS type A sorting domain-containing protein [Hymenobacter sp. HD11105]
MKILHTGIAALGAVFLSLSVPQTVQAQFRTPVVNGVVGPNEYGNEYANPNNDDPNLKWRVTWDDTNLYVVIEDANLQQGTVLYLDTDPQTPVNAGERNPIKGQPISGGINGNLPIQADIFILAEKFYREVRVFSKETGQWSEPREWGKPTDPDVSKRIGQYADNGGADGEKWSSRNPERNFSGTVKEFALPWSLISTTGARPKNFNWFGFVVYGFDPISMDDPDTEEQEPTIPNPVRGGLYGQAPRDNDGTFRFNDVDGRRYEDYNWTRYFTVLNTDAGSDNSAFGPNGTESFSYTGPAVSTLGGISVYDFTVNSPNAILTRVGDGNSVIWNIQNNLTVANNSTLNFGATTAPVIVGGDIRVTGEGVIRYPAPAGTLTIGRNIQLATANSFLVNAGVTLTGTGAQTISTDNNAPVDLRLLTIQGAGVKTLNTNLDIRETLILNNGILTTGTNQVRLIPGARLTENAPGYLLGRIATSTLTPLNVPGASSDFGGIGLRITQRGNDLPGAIDVLRITGGRGLLQAGSATVPNQTIARRFFINNNPTNNSGTNVTLDFTYRDIPPTELNGNTEAALRLYESSNIADPVNGYQLVTPSNANTPNAATNTLTYAGNLRLNRYFSLADGNTPLPVELISFAGKAENNVVRLTWATASELQNKGFEVERRTEQGEWQKLGFVAGNGTTNQRHNYNYLDRSAVAGNNYYRLRQIDLDGKSVYSQVVAVQVGAVAFSLSPVPATDVLTINGLSAGKHVAEIYNARGQRVLSQEFSDAAASTITVSALPAGVYMVRVLGPGQSTQNARFIKQ